MYELVFTDRAFTSHRDIFLIKMKLEYLYISFAIVYILVTCIYFLVKALESILQAKDKTAEEYIRLESKMRTMEQEQFELKRELSKLTNSDFDIPKMEFKAPIPKLPPPRKQLLTSSSTSTRSNEILYKTNYKNT